MGLVRRSAGDESGALHRIMSEALLPEPLRGWDSNELGNQTGLSNTGIHHQITKLKECGLVTLQVEGKWHRHILRGGSIEAATRLVEVQSIAILKLRLSELSELVEPSETRMAIEVEESENPFSIKISEPRPRSSEEDGLLELADDLGLAGDSRKEDDTLARDLLSELCSAHYPLTLLTLSDRLSETRGRVGTAIGRMRSAGIVERVPMVDRIPQDVFTGLTRQLDARGLEWVMTRGGLGRLEESVSALLASEASDGSLSIEGVRAALSSVPLSDQRVLLNTLGGRMPYGFRLSGSDGAMVSARVMRSAERALRRIRTVADRLGSTVP